MHRSKKSPTHSDNAAAVTAVKEVYRDLEKLSIERTCTLKTECCHFLLTGKTPFLTKGEALVAAKALRATGRKELPTRNDGACKLLHPTKMRCLIYNDRPFGCRTHFCEAAGGPYSRKEVIGFIHRLEAIDRELGGDAPHEIHTAIEEIIS